MDRIKLGVVAAFAAISARLGILAVPIYILVGANLIDYGTGVAAAHFRNEQVNSDKGLRGIAKKVAMWVLIGVGAAADWLIEYSTEAIGIQVPVAFFIASAVAIWLICNELISILENVADIGAPLPPFLLDAVKRVKQATEAKADEKEREEMKHDKRN